MVSPVGLDRSHTKQAEEEHLQPECSTLSTFQNTPSCSSSFQESITQRSIMSTAIPCCLQEMLVHVNAQASVRLFTQHSTDSELLQVISRKHPLRWHHKSSHAMLPADQCFPYIQKVMPTLFWSAFKLLQVIPRKYASKRDNKSGHADRP